MLMHLTDCLYRILFLRYRPLKLALSCEVVHNRSFLGPRFVGEGIPQILDMGFQIAVTSTMWPILVEFDSATSEIRRRKKLVFQNVSIRPATVPRSDCPIRRAQ